MKRILKFGFSIAALGAAHVYAATGFVSATACSASAAGPTPGNIVISGNPDKFHLVANNRKLNAVCHFGDTSGVYEKNAEQQKLDLCRIFTSPTTWVDGTGHVVASASPNTPAGGNATIRCQADLPN